LKIRRAYNKLGGWENKISLVYIFVRRDEVKWPIYFLTLQVLSPTRFSRRRLLFRHLTIVHKHVSNDNYHSLTNLKKCFEQQLIVVKGM